MQLNCLRDDERSEQVERLHGNAFAWRPQGRIPLGIHVVDPGRLAGLTYDQWLEPEPFFRAQRNILLDTLTVGSDLLPMVPLNHLGGAPLTSMFGAEQFMPEMETATLQDVGPAPLQVFTDIAQVRELEIPPPDAGIMPAVEDMLRFYRKNLPSWVGVVGPMPTGPFSTAMELRGSDLLTDLVDQPELASRLILLCAEVEARTYRRCREILAAPGDRYPTNFLIAGAGVRLGEDSICNLSPRMIRDFCGPAVRMIMSICGGRGHIHFCSLAHSRFEHLYATLREMAEVAVISSQFGFEYYQDHVDELRGRLAVEAFYGDAYAYVRERYGSFQEWACDFVPRFKNESGLVLYMQVASVEEGHDVWATWQEAHRK